VGPQFVFNMGGGNGFRVHQFGGNTPRRRPRDATGQTETPRDGFHALTQLLPLLLLFLLPLLSSFFTGSNSTPTMRFDQPVPPHTMHRVTPKYKIDYFINPADVHEYSLRKFTSLDQRAEVDYISHLRTTCEWETRRRDDEIKASQGFFYSDEERLQKAMEMDMPGCSRLEALRVRRQY
jgi:DnaJ homolog subfamily B member 12